jgi:hypothetical protein
MPTRDPEPMLTLSKLRRALAVRGLEYSDSQLKRRRRDGLLPVGAQRHRGGVRGSESLYPAWAVDQLELVSRISTRERRFAQLRALVRWHGGWVRPDQLRAAMVELLEPISSAARAVTDTVVDQTDRADRLAQDMTAHPGRSGISRLMRQRLDNVAEDIERTMYAFSALATRSPVEWENHDPENPAESLLTVVERAFGIDRARQDEIGGQGPLMCERESSERMLAQLQQAGAFDLLDLAAVLSAASEEAIERAFEDAIAFACLSGAFEAIETIAGQDVAGLGSVSEIGGADAVIDRVMLVRGLLLIRPLVPEGAPEEVVKAATNARRSCVPRRSWRGRFRSTRGRSARTVPSGSRRCRPRSARPSSVRSAPSSTPTRSWSYWGAGRMWRRRRSGRERPSGQAIEPDVVRSRVAQRVEEEDERSRGAIGPGMKEHDHRRSVGMAKQQLSVTASCLLSLAAAAASKRRG